MFTWFESLIGPFRAAPLKQPPDHWLSFYWHFIRQVWPVFLAIMAIGLLAGIIELALFSFLGQLVDLVRASDTPQSFFGQHGTLLLWMLAVAVLIRPIAFALHILIVNQTINANFTNLIRWQNHRYVLRQSLSFFQDDFAGRIATRIMQTGPSVRQTVTQLVNAIWFVVVYTVGAVILFSDADILLIVPLLIWLTLYIACLSYFVPRLKDRAADMSEAGSTLMGRVVDCYTNMTTVKLFAHTRAEDQYAREAVQEHTDVLYRLLRTSSACEIYVTILSGLLIGGTCSTALWLWSEGSISLGVIAFATALVIRIDNMAGWIMFVMTSIFENVGRVQEGIRTISNPITVKDRDDAKELAITRGEIRYDNVAFGYGRETPMMTEMNLTIRPGEKIGLVGRSGAGKSTLVNLLLRFYDLDGGRILIDGEDISHVTQESLRAHIGVVTQDTSLLHRSVYDNILYGRKNASESEVIAAAKKAHAHEFIVGLEDYKGRKGYEAHVGERGVKLSGGQRQRVAIARVLLKDAPFLILDEATSALDSEVEAAIQEQLYNLMRNKTVIAIAHRFSTIAAMDRLIVLDRAKILEEGTHNELMRKPNGLYAQLWSRQSGGFHKAG